mmetsp:Transcript_21919/g.54151  ORF Transcript_21919/g.54151 Transcript_21919/m.54151 type:complete len:284 (-) Transcript_21919:100-951(-)
MDGMHVRALYQAQHLTSAGIQMQPRISYWSIFLKELSSKSKPKKCRQVAAGMTSNDFICLSNSLIYEMTPDGYLPGKKPTALEEYNLDFANSDTEIELLRDGAPFLECRGCVSSDSHHFLKAEGAYQCHLYRNTLCRSCLWDPSSERDANGCQPICLPCKVESFLGVDEVTEGDMRKFLRNHHVSCPATANYEEVLSLYHMYNSNDDDMFADAIVNVQYSLLPASALHFTQLFAPDSKILPTVDNMDKKGPIESIIRDMSVAQKDVVNFICLLSSLTYFEKQA